MNIQHLYLLQKATGNKSTERNYRHWIIRFTEAVGDVNKVSLEEVIMFFSRLKEIEYKPGKKYKDSTIKYSQIIIRDFLKFADRYDLWKKFKPIKAHENSWEPLTQEEFDRVDRAIDDSVIWGLQFRIIHHLLWETGMRISELCNLNWKDIDIRKPELLIKTAKSKKERFVLWSEQTHLLLVKFLEIRPYMHECPSLFIGRSSGSRWDKNAMSNRRVISRSIQNWLQLIGRELNINLHPHKYRHGWAVKRRELKASLAFVQQGLGHANPESTFKYLKYGPEWKDEARGYL